MTISTIQSIEAGPRARATQRGFTLVEVMIGGTLGSFVLAGVLTAFLMLGRTGANAANYCMMEAQSRRALEELSQDLRMASGVAWNSSTSITLTVPDNYPDLAVPANNHKVTYAYDNSAKTFFRMPGISTSGNPQTTLISNLATFVYTRYDRIDNPASDDPSTKRIQLAMTVRTSRTTLVAASNNILSASFILRNKQSN